MQINSKQLKVLQATTAVILMMLLFPPYQISGYGPSSQAIMQTGYSFLFDLPERAYINAASLLVQWIGICLSGAIGIFIFNSNNP